MVNNIPEGLITQFCFTWAFIGREPFTVIFSFLYMVELFTFISFLKFFLHFEGVYKYCLKEFGEDCIFTDRPRFEDFDDWRGVGKDTYELTDEKYQKEVEDCILDVILTSKSDHILGTCSNMFLGALSMNTENTCELIQKQFWGA